MDEQIAALRAALAAVEASIAQTTAALATATVPQDIAALRAVLVDLKAERAKLQLQLANLEAAAVEVQPLGAARGRAMAAPVPSRLPAARRAQVTAIEKKLEAAIADRTVARATLAVAKRVMADARRLRTIGDAPPPKTVKTVKTVRKGAGRK
jgi:hypothetical protein